MADGEEAESDTDSLNVCPSEPEGKHLEDRDGRIYVCTAEEWETQLVIPSPSRINSWHRNAIRSVPCTIVAITAELEEYDIERGDGYKLFCGFCDREFGSVSADGAKSHQPGRPDGSASNGSASTSEDLFDSKAASIDPAALTRILEQVRVGQVACKWKHEGVGFAQLHVLAP